MNVLLLLMLRLLLLIMMVMVMVRMVVRMPVPVLVHVTGWVLRMVSGKSVAVLSTAVSRHAGTALDDVRSIPAVFFRPVGVVVVATASPF